MVTKEIFRRAPGFSEQDFIIWIVKFVLNLLINIIYIILSYIFIILRILIIQIKGVSYLVYTWLYMHKIIGIYLF